MNIAYRPLTWQQVAVVLLVLAGMVCGFVMIARGVPQDVKTKAAAGLAGSVALALLLLLWHWRDSKRPDLMPDVLAALVPESRINQAGAAHVTVTAFQHGPYLRVEFLAQNVFDGEGHLFMSLFPKWGQQVLAAQVPPLDFTLPPSGVVAATLNLPLYAVTAPVPLRLALSGRCRRASGRRVRFARREVVNKPMLPAVAVADAMTGGGGPGTFADLIIQPLPPGTLFPEHRPYVCWRYETVWSPDERTTPDEVVSLARADLPTPP